VSQPITVRVPLTAFEAYWHACTGTPVVDRYVPLMFDPECTVAGFVTPRGTWDWFKTPDATLLSRETLMNHREDPAAPGRGDG
jgi:hypothetical protein